nr:hypothetical protein [candidate division Zixibacteria bacterium]
MPHASIIKGYSEFPVLLVFFTLLLLSCDTKKNNSNSNDKYDDRNLSVAPPAKYEGIIRDIDIKVEKLPQGWNISLKNNLWASELYVWFDNRFQGTIERANEYREKYVWKTFFTPTPVKRVIVGVIDSPYDKDIGRAWYKDI